MRTPQRKTTVRFISALAAAAVSAGILVPSATAATGTTAPPTVALTVSVADQTNGTGILTVNNTGTYLAPTKSQLAYAVKADYDRNGTYETTVKARTALVDKTKQTLTLKGKGGVPITGKPVNFKTYVSLKNLATGAYTPMSNLDKVVTVKGAAVKPTITMSRFLGESLQMTIKNGDLSRTQSLAIYVNSVKVNVGKTSLAKGEVFTTPLIKVLEGQTAVVYLSNPDTGTVRYSFTNTDLMVSVA